MSGNEDLYDVVDPGDDRVGIDDDVELDSDSADSAESADSADFDDDDDYDDDDDDFDDLEDAGEEDVDYIVSLHREDGVAAASPLPMEAANDLDELIASLQRLPGDAGAAAIASIAGEFFVLVRYFERFDSYTFGNFYQHNEQLQLHGEFRFRP